MIFVLTQHGRNGERERWKKIAYKLQFSPPLLFHYFNLLLAFLCFIPSSFFSLPLSLSHTLLHHLHRIAYLIQYNVPLCISPGILLICPKVQSTVWLQRTQYNIYKVGMYRQVQDAGALYAIIRVILLSLVFYFLSPSSSTIEVEMKKIPRTK